MYPTSTAYKVAIKRNVRDVKITGTITLKDDTVINITDDDILLGSLYFTEQCVSGEDIEVGNVYASELGLTLTSPPENPYALDGARIVLNFGINTEPDPEEEPIWEYVPLGYFYVTEIQRKNTAVNLKALDGLILFDVDLSGVLTTGTPYSLIQSCCTKAGVVLATSSSAFENFANGLTAFTIPEDSKIETCRDLIMWLCQLTGTFARMNRMGQLEVVPITAGAPVKTINKAERFTSDVSDFYVKITKVTMKIGEEEYSQGTAGMTLALEENPLLAGKSEAEINTALAEILDQVTEAEYTPYNLTFAGDPALQAGDWVKLTGTIGTAASLVTHTSWRYRGPHNIQAVGKSSYLRGVTGSQQQKTVSSIRAIAKVAQEIAQAANQSTQLINDAIGGNVLIRQGPDHETNEILIMDNPNPALAVKIWRWNMGGLGYSDNCVGADNPQREYEVAMTMDGAINANFIKAGKIAAQYISVGPESDFAEGYDPTAIKIGGRNLIIRYNEIPDTMIGENGVSAPLVGSSMVNDFIPVQPGDNLTFSQIIQSGTGDDYFRCAFYTDPLDDAVYVVRRISNSSTEFQETVPEGAYWLRVSYATKNKVQLEKGTKATDWTPAPEDVEAYAEHKATEAQAAAEAVARAEAELAETQAKAYADGIVDAEEQARIDDANAKLAEAKAYAETKSGEAQTAAQAYAEQKAAEAQAAAEAVARAEAALAQAQAEAYADGKVTAEEQARIDQAEANLAAAKTHAEQKAAEAKQGAKDYASQILKNLADGEYPDGTFITGKSIYTPEVYAGRMHGLRGTFHDLLAGNPEGSRIEMGEKLIAAQAKVSRPEYAIASGFGPGHEPSKAFDGDTGTYWERNVGDFVWIGQEFPEPVCVKAVRRYCASGPLGGDALLFCLIYYDESAGTWRNLDYLDSLYGEGWSQQNVNPGNVYAEKWACSINTIASHYPVNYYVYELEFYDERFSPFVDGYATKTQKAFELNAAGIGTFDGFFFMDGYPAGVIIEQGSNSNGSYIKWSNGLQVCWHTMLFSSAELTVGEHTKTWTLPKSFVSASGYALFVDLSTEPRDRAKGTATGQRAHSRSASSADYYLAIATGFYSAASVELFAIGWWK